jgi:amino acid transporter
MPNGFSGVMAAVSGVFFAYIGFDAVSVLAEESKNPQKDLPRGMILSLVICTIIYILLTLVLTGAVNYRNFDGVGDPLAFIFEKQNLNVPFMQLLVSICAVIAMTSVLLVFQMGQPRIWMSMSRDGLLPPVFQKIHSKFKTPSFATIITGLVVGVPILFTDKTFVLDFTSIATLFAFVLVCGGVLLIPRRAKVPGKFNLPYINGQFIFPALIIGAVLILTTVTKGYFKGILEMDLNAKDQENVLYEIIAGTKGDLNDGYILTSNEMNIIEKRLKDKTQAEQLAQSLEHNNKMLNTLVDSVAFNAITQSDAYKNSKSTENEVNDSGSLINPGNQNIIQQIKNSIVNYPKASVIDPVLVQSVNKSLAAEEDADLLSKFNNQLQAYKLITIDSLKESDSSLVKAIDGKFAEVSPGQVKDTSAADLMVKQTQNVSTIIFWIICILLAIFAFFKRWSLIPLLGLTTCLYLLTGMTKLNWLWFGGWLLLGLIFYLLYGYKKSKLALLSAAKQESQTRF